MVSIPRIRKLYEAPSFLGKVFTAEERAFACARRTPWTHLAGRFAAKEAVMKALGTGWGDGVGWKDIEVQRRGAAPFVRLHARAKELLGARRIFITLSYTEEFAAAFAVIE